MNLRSLACYLAALGMVASATVWGDELRDNRTVAFTLTAPIEFRGMWERPFAPFVHPIQTRNWVNVRVERFDPQSGSVEGRFDMYVRSICEDIVDEPFRGTFDGRVLRLSYEYQICPRMKPLALSLWKEQDGFRGRVNRLPVVIHHTVPDQAP